MIPMIPKSIILIIADISIKIHRDKMVVEGTSKDGILFKRERRFPHAEDLFDLPLKGLLKLAIEVIGVIKEENPHETIAP